MKESIPPAAIAWVCVGVCPPTVMRKLTIQLEWAFRCYDIEGNFHPDRRFELKDCESSFKQYIHAMRKVPENIRAKFAKEVREGVRRDLEGHGNDDILICDFNGDSTDETESQESDDEDLSAAVRRKYCTPSNRTDIQTLTMSMPYYYAMGTAAVLFVLIDRLMSMPYFYGYTTGTDGYQSFSLALIGTCWFPARRDGNGIVLKGII
jgi:hypothetical protein